MKIVRIVLVACLLFLGSSDVFAGKGYSSGGGRSYSSSGSSGFSRSPSFSSGSSSGKSYSSGGGKGYSNSSSTSKSYSFGTSSKPTGSFQSLAAHEQKNAASRVAYEKATAPKESYVTPKGNTVTIKKDDVRVTQIRNMPEDKWVHRDTRLKDFYGPYYTTPYAIHYNDPYPSFFWLWLLDRSLDDRAYWAYHHKDVMDEARYKDLLAKDATLEARIKQIEIEKKGHRDPSYVPPGISDPDFQYSDDYVDAVRNPEPSEITFADFLHGLWWFMKWICLPILIIAVFFFLVWACFFYEY